ncbi:response regulator [Methylobacterium pseudosasicola]|uniref:Response regulator receiver domain-containing protein n=1 Tax=Methylobacterium pseudosasicola TaxID=582667 RepID=A0A1I4R5V9_9HYPH|nr:response regulator [Methylobacterium pseudosasicola]SFM47694.1 Response regulator receiver domain-containing protein [Methylobacterium pseudosasicola]
MKTILIVEDVELNRDLLTQLLEDDYTLVIAVDGGAGVAMAASHAPDLILMDLSLPVIDGWEATRRIKSDPATARIPIIAITANAMSGDADKARAAGCDDFMTKPVDEDLLFAKLRHWLD